jgi:hypothetical protein
MESPYECGIEPPGSINHGVGMYSMSQHSKYIFTHSMKGNKRMVLNSYTY